MTQAEQIAALKAQLQQATQQPTERSIWQNIKYIITGAANATGYAFEMLGNFSKSGNELGKATLIMSESNTKLVSIKTKGEEQKELKVLKDQYPDLNLDEFK